MDTKRATETVLYFITGRQPDMDHYSFEYFSLRDLGRAALAMCRLGQNDLRIRAGLVMWPST